jgi:hypothetical protein
VGQNVPLDASYSTMPVFSNRTLAVVQSQHLTTNPYSTNYPSGSLDVNGLPTTGYTVKVVDGVAMSDADLQGTWCVKYTAASHVNVSVPFPSGTTLLTDTFSAGHGMATFTYPGGNALVVAFDAPTTSLPEIYSPTTSATAIAGGTPTLWDPVFLQTTGAYGYLRVMDIVNANQDYVNKTANTWPTSNAWSTRATPANYATSTIDGSNRGIPLEWQLDLSTRTGLPIWTNVPTLADDDYVTQFTTMIATSQPNGTHAMFECVGNERWNFSGGFYTYQKTGAAALAETLYGTSVSVFVQHAQRVVGVTTDGTTATVQFLNPHGLTVGASSNKVGVLGNLANAKLWGGTIFSSGLTYAAMQSAVHALGTGTLSVVCGGTTFNSGTIDLTTITGDGSSNNSLGNAAATAIAAAFTSPTFTVAYDSTSRGFNFTTTSVLSTAAISLATGTLATNLGLTSGAGGVAAPSFKLLRPDVGTSLLDQATCPTFTVVDSVTISFPCTMASTASVQYAGTMIFGNTSSGVGGGISLNAASNLFTYGTATGAYGLGNAWFFRRSWQVAALIRAAWVAAGRSLSDCKTILPFQAGTTYANLEATRTFLSSVNSGQPLSTVFTAVCVGGYYTPQLNNGGTMNPGYGFTASNSTPVTSADVLSQLRTFVDHTPAAYLYGSLAAWSSINGLDMYGYEVGVDTSGVTAASAATAANADPLMEGITRDFFYGLAKIGFKRAGYYQCGAGPYAGQGCFNVGQTAVEANWLSPLISRSPKLQGILDAQARPAALPVTDYASGTISGWDCVGNEAILNVPGAWPTLGGTGFPSTPSIAFALAQPGSAGLVYRRWSETTQTKTFQLTGHTTGGSTSPITVQNGSSTGTFTAPAATGSAGAGAVLGTCSITLRPGMNYIAVTTSSGQKNSVSPHAIDFL